MPNVNPLLLFASAFVFSALAGLSAALSVNGKRGISLLAAFSSFLHGGLMGLAACLWWYNDFRAKENIPGLIGLCILLGMGGWPMTNFLLSLIYKGGFKISLDKTSDPPTEKNP